MLARVVFRVLRQARLEQTNPGTRHGSWTTVDYPPGYLR
jgi:hypothetical protein